MRLMAIDPGPEESGWLLCQSRPFKILECGITKNEELLSRLMEARVDTDFCRLAIEKIAMGGMIAGLEVFETAYWVGRFCQAVWPIPFERMGRVGIKVHICGDSRAKDVNVRQALLDKFGGSKAKGVKKAQGPLYQIKGHLWSALAVAVAYIEKTTKEEISLS